MSKVPRRFGVSPSSSGRPPQNVRVKPETTGNLMTLLVHNTELFLIFLFICRIDSRKMFASIRDGWLPLSKYLTREQSYVCESKKKKGITNIRNRFVLFSYRRMFRINGSRKFHNILKISVWVSLQVYPRVLQYLSFFARFARATSAFRKFAYNAHAFHVENKRECKSQVYMRHYLNCSLENVMVFSAQANLASTNRYSLWKTTYVYYDGWFV